jgi:hypothetical protein
MDCFPGDALCTVIMSATSQELSEGPDEKGLISKISKQADENEDLKK